MAIPIFAVLIRTEGQKSSSEVHMRRIDQMVASVQKFMPGAFVRTRIHVENVLDAKGEWLHFNLVASAQGDLWRTDTGMHEQVEQEARDLREKILSQLSMLSESTAEIRLNPSRFWEIFPTDGPDSAVSKIVRAANDLPLKRLHIDDGEQTQFSIELKDFPKNFACIEPLQLSIAVRMVSSHRAICRITRPSSLQQTRVRKEVRVVWSESSDADAISRRMLNANRERRPIEIRAHLVKDFYGVVHSLEFVSFTPKTGIAQIAQFHRGTGLHALDGHR